MRYGESVERMLRAASDVYRRHSPGKDGVCRVKGCHDAFPTTPCLPFKTADAVLDLWKNEQYWIVAG